jgi:hypothetical protein
MIRNTNVDTTTKSLPFEKPMLWAVAFWVLKI